MKIAVTGGTGLVGSALVELLAHKHKFVQLSRSTGVDITDASSLQNLAHDSSISVVLHLAAATDVDACEQEKDLGNESNAWKMNVGGTTNVVNACRVTQKKVIYVSTDFIFNGEKGNYTENDTPSPINWYGTTKYQGERVVQDSGLSSLIVRPSYPYRSQFEGKKDFMRAIKTRLESGQSVAAITDHIFTPTYIDDFVYAIDRLLEENKTGIYHVVGDGSLTPYDASVMIASTFGLDASLIQKTTREQYFKSGAKRPFNLSMKNDKIKSLGVQMKTFQQGLEEVKRQLD